MPFGYEIDPARCLVLITAEGVGPPDAWFETMHRIVADPRFAPGFDFLYDRRSVAHVPDTMYVRAWIFRQAELMASAGGGRLAVVVGTPAIYGMVRMASAFADGAGLNMRAFWSVEEAMHWLGRNSDSSVA